MNQRVLVISRSAVEMIVSLQSLVQTRYGVYPLFAVVDRIKKVNRLQHYSVTPRFAPPDFQAPKDPEYYVTEP